MNETLQEFCDSQGVSVRVDRQAGIIRGVKILGLESRNRRSYLPEALARAVPLYEEAKVNVNHPKGHPTGPRDYQERIGLLRGVTWRAGEGLFADFHFNPRHALAEQLIWDAEHAPENVGFSHNVEAQTTRRDGQLVVEAICKVQSVDLVADPATTRGLFEAADPSGGELLGRLTLDELQRGRPDLVEALAAPQRGRIQQLESELERFRDGEAVREREAAACRLLREFRLPPPEAGGSESSITSPAFMKLLLAAADEAAMRTLVEERSRLVAALSAGAAPGGKPQSRDQGLLAGSEQPNLQGFVEAVLFSA